MQISDEKRRFMNKQKIADFFDRCAPWWDADMQRNEEVIAKILDKGGVKEGVRVLDVACGTGVLFPDYLSRGVASVTGIDLSPEMVKIAREKFPQVEVLCGDVECTDFPQKFDVIMVYNAFPHFPQPQKLIDRLCGLLAEGGRLTVAHGMSRAALLEHHKNVMDVSVELLPAEELAALMSRHLTVDVVISDETMYQVSARRDAAV